MKCGFIIFFSFLFYTKSQKTTNFLCLDGAAIHLTKVCDGLEDCSDGSDEKSPICRHILCPQHTFRCHYGACIPLNLKCNGIKNCADGSDESSCGKIKHTCNSSEYKCLSGECIPNFKICDGIFDCKDNSDEKNICQKNLCPVLTHRCRVGNCIHLNQTCDGQNDCIDGSDEILCDKQNHFFCPAIVTKRITSRCVHPIFGKISCQKSIPVNTMVTYECKKYYKPIFKHKNNKDNHCQLDGTWNREILNCVPDCKVEDLTISPLIVKGFSATKGQYPWHSVLYLLEDGNWTFICGASLLNERVVLTAAHCVWELPIHIIQVAVGKYYSDYYTPETEAQIRNISNIIIEPNYQDVIGHYESDIAILILQKAIKFSQFVRPICLNKNYIGIRDAVKSNLLGLVVGMGVTENDTVSPTLRASYLQVISNPQCRKNQKRDFKKYVTFTSFCAGWLNGTSVCNGDSGGGLIIESPSHTKKLIIHGIVSVSPRKHGTSLCDSKHYTVFTKVAIYVKWINDVLRKYHLK